MPRALVVDDEPAMRNVLLRCLETGGYDVDVFSRADAAIVAMKSGRHYDVLVTDQMMPGMTGTELVAVVQRLDPGLPCVVVTAFSDFDTAVSALHAGAAGFVPKPFRREHLLAMVEESIQRKRWAADSYRLRHVLPMLERVTLLLANSIEAKSGGLQRHCERLAMYAGAVGRHLGLPATDIAILRIGAGLHDVGKVAIPNSILDKSGKLGPEEWEQVKRHVEIGAEIIPDVDYWSVARRIVRHHHERWDGAGYPDRLRGEDIPLGARVVGLVDAFDVMRSGRSYRRALSLDQTLEEIARCRERQFDPECVDALLAAVHDDDVDFAGGSVVGEPAFVAVEDLPGTPQQIHRDVAVG